MALILIVDDSKTTRNAVRKVLKHEGHETLEAANGEEGLELAAAHGPDCIVLDLIMPRMDGFEVLKALHKKGSNIPVIVLSADIQEIVREDCLKLGADAFINKPLKGDELLGTIDNVLGLKKETSNESESGAS